MWPKWWGLDPETQTSESIHRKFMGPMLGVQCSLQVSNSSEGVGSDVDSHQYLCNIFGHVSTERKKSAFVITLERIHSELQQRDIQRSFKNWALLEQGIWTLFIAKHFWANPDFARTEETSKVSLLARLIWQAEQKDTLAALRELESTAVLDMEIPVQIWEDGEESSQGPE